MVIANIPLPGNHNVMTYRNNSGGTFVIRPRRAGTAHGGAARRERAVLPVLGAAHRAHPVAGLVRRRAWRSRVLLFPGTLSPAMSAGTASFLSAMFVRGRPDPPMVWSSQVPTPFFDKFAHIAASDLPTHARQTYHAMVRHAVSINIDRGDRNDLSFSI